MALSDSVLGGLIDTNLIGDGAIGPKRTSFAHAVAKGVVESIVGQTFTTTDVGLVPGTGTGIGTGITGLSSTTMVTTAKQTMTGFPRLGPKVDTFLHAIMDAVVAHLSAAASLASVDAPVFTGTGTVDIGSISVTIATMKANIKQEIINDGADAIKAYNLDNLALSLATGIVQNILSSGTGTLVITGSGSITPVPGTGTGTGTIS